MKVLVKIFKGLITVILVLLLLIAALDAAWVFEPQVKASKKISDIGDYGKAGYEVEIPEGVSIVALGEATHGNAEFQELKLSVFKHLVDTTDVRSFALEADFGEGIVINEYVHGTGNIKDAKEAVKELSFNIYQTKQMTDLIQWMHDYNQSAGEADKLSFYGFDMQNPDIDAGVIAEFCDKSGIVPKSGSTALLKEFAEGKTQISDDRKAAFYEDIAGIKESLAGNDPKTHCIEIACDCILKAKELGELDENDYLEYNNVRDKAMAGVVSKILSLEKNLGHDMIYITGHNGHVSTHRLNYKTMGENIREDFGNKYFIIGTDYYKTTCNIAGEDGRGNYSFCSADPLAYQAKYFDGMYCIRFRDVIDKSTGETYETLRKTINTGSLGESYMPLMHFLPTSHRVKMEVLKGYNAMIYVYEATPIEVLPR